MGYPRGRKKKKNERKERQTKSTDILPEDHV
jgi:hypothetical protein